MKFSILLPTRDRLEYLRYAVETVLRQDYDDWELIVSDNCSVDDVAGYVASLDDERIRYLHTSAPVSVTENWNRALDASSGEYVLMLGDDDGLLPGYFKKADQAITEFDEPDVVYSRALLFAYPDVMPGREAGYVHTMGCAAFFEKLDEPRLLERRVAHDLVRASMALRLRFDFNMQLFTIKRSTIESLRRNGKFFHSPFPDYYAANLVFLRSSKIVIHPEPLAVVGITPKSYGFFHFNRREDEGVEFLRNMGNERDRKLDRFLLPGNRMNTCWLIAMETLSELDAAPDGFVPDRRRYRLLQVASALRRGFLERSLSREESRELVRSLRMWEKGAYALSVALLLVLRTAGRRETQAIMALDRRLGQYPISDPPMTVGKYCSVLDLLERVESEGVGPLEMRSSPSDPR